MPFKYTLRDYQKPLWRAIFNEEKKRAVYVWHRRAGKDLFGLNVIIVKALTETPGTYWHVFPTYAQGAKAIWNETDKDGRRYLDYIPEQFIESKNEKELKIRFKNGSVYQIVGSDNVDALRGAGIKGAVFSEFAEQRPSAWEVIQPMLMATDGFAIFNFTPKGHNHAYSLYEMAKLNSNWFTQLLTVEDTKSQVFTSTQIEEIKQEFLGQGKTLDLFNQEYYCSFNSAIEGAYYSNALNELEKANKISCIPFDPMLQVSTWWDLGVNDTTAIWFTQVIGREIRVIDFYENKNFGLDHYIKMIKEKPYIYESHNAPHDIAVREFTNGKSRLETAMSLGINFSIVPNIPVEDGINAVRSILPRCFFDKEKCKQGLLSLKNYKKKFDEIRNAFSSKPLHDWSSNAADAFRYFAVGFSDRFDSQTKSQSYIYQPSYY